MRRFHSGFALLLLAAVFASAAETRRWIADGAEEFLKGRGEGVAVTADGRLERSPVWTHGTRMDEPVLVAGGLMPDGSLIVGTGHPARLYRITDGGKELLAELPAEQVTAVLVIGTDEVLVASVAPGVLHRWHRGRLAEVARLGDGGIWDLAHFDDSVVVAATFSPEPRRDYRIGFPAEGQWLVRFNNDRKTYDAEFSDVGEGPVTAERHEYDRRPASGIIELGPYSVILLSQ